MGNKLETYQEGRTDGLLLARKLVKEHGVEQLDKEIAFRNRHRINMALSTKDLDVASNEIKLMSFDCATVIAVMTLRDEFDYGKTRLERFLRRFNEKRDAIYEDMATWDDYMEAVREETGVDLTIRYR